jgi:hypothetical protein
MPRMFRPLVVCALAVLPLNADAACMNKFLSRTDSGRQVITFLTGKLTFQEAKDLSAAIAARERPPLEWVSDDGKAIAKQWGELKVVRPMPVGCDDKKSGVVMIAMFPTHNKPLRKMSVKFDADRTVTFEQQTH